MGGEDMYLTFTSSKSFASYMWLMIVAACALWFNEFGPGKSFLWDYGLSATPYAFCALLSFYSTYLAEEGVGLSSHNPKEALRHRHKVFALGAMTCACVAALCIYMYSLLATFVLFAEVSRSLRSWGIGMTIVGLVVTFTSSLIATRWMHSFERAQGNPAASYALRGIFFFSYVATPAVMWFLSTQTTLLYIAALAVLALSFTVRLKTAPKHQTAA